MLVYTLCRKGHGRLKQDKKLDEIKTSDVLTFEKDLGSGLINLNE